MMKFLFVVAIFGSLLSFSQSRNGWIELFDGKSLNGWHTIPGGQWTISKGIIIGKSEASDERHGLLVTDSVYDDFELQVSYKAIKGNSGLYFRVEEVGGIVGVNGFQAEIDPKADAGGLYETGGRAWVVKPDSLDVRKWYKPGKWNRMTVIARGASITVLVNGYTTAELKNDPGRRSGHLALQLHGGMNMHVEFKEIKLRRLAN